MPQAPPPTILVVDDDPASRHALSELVADGGYTVRAAADGRAAFDLSERTRPDLVITDLIMPNLDGWDVVVQLRQRGLRIPVILISGQTRPATDPSIHFLAKPLDPDQLLTTIGKLLASAPQPST